MFRRDNIKLILVASVCLVVGLSAPAVSHGVHARFAHAADRVDGKHAVGAGASTDRRTGRLVATGADGRLPDNIIAKAPDADAVDGIDSPQLQFPTQVPVNHTVVGSWGFDANTDGSGHWGTRISYPAPMPTPLAYHFVPFGGTPPSECPGTATDPDALPGHVCVFSAGSFGASTDPFQGFDPDRFGVGLVASDDGTAGDLWARGTWAATAAATSPSGRGQMRRQ